MRYEDIETFLQVCRSGGISQAAQAMFLAQSTVSQRIRRLEEDLNCSLLIRKSGVRSLALTLRGQKFFAAAEKLCSAWNEASGLNRGETEPLRRLSVGSIASVYEMLLPPLLGALRRTGTETQVRTLVGRSPELYDMAESGTLDFVFTAIELRSSTLSCTRVFEEKYVCVSSRNLLPQGARLGINNLTSFPELFYSWDSRFRHWHDSVRSHSPYLHCDTPSVWLNLAQTMKFWTICPYSAVLYLRTNGLLFDVHELVDPPANRGIYLVRRPAGDGLLPENELFMNTFSCFYETLPKELKPRELPNLT